MYKLLLFLFCGIFTVNSSAITNHAPCRQDDHACLTKLVNMIYKQAVIIGVPSLDIQSLEPLYQDEIVGNLATVKYTLKKTTFEGFRKCFFVNASVSLERNKLYLELVCPNITMAGEYIIDGKILGIAIQGNGDHNVESKDYDIFIDADLKVNQRYDGKNYISIKTFKLRAYCRGGTHFDLRNLFNGQKELGDNVLKFMNDHNKLVASQLHGPVFNANLKRIFKNFNKYLKPIPLDTLIVSE